MKIILRKIILLCISLVLLSNCVLGVYASGENATTAVSEQKELLNTKEYQLLSNLGMLAGEKMPIYDGKNITRAEFGYVLARITGYSEG